MELDDAVEKVSYEGVPTEVVNELGKGEHILKSAGSRFNRIIATDKRLIIAKLLKPKSFQKYSYKDINSVENRRLVRFEKMAIMVFFFLLSSTFLLLREVADLTSQFLSGIESSIGNLPFAHEHFVIFLAIVFGLLGLYSLFSFLGSLKNNLIVYLVDGTTITMPMKLNSETLQFMSLVNQKVRKSSELSREEIEQIIGEKLGSLLQERMRIEQQLIETLRAQARAAKTEEEKANVRELMQESISKLEEQDSIIERELVKTGISREEIFKKYHIKEPKQEFIDALLEEGKDIIESM